MTTMTLFKQPYGSMICDPTALWWNSACESWPQSRFKVSFKWTSNCRNKWFPSCPYWALSSVYAPSIVVCFSVYRAAWQPEFHYRWFNINQCCFRFSFRCLLLAHRYPGVIFHVSPIHSCSCSIALWCFSIMNENKWLQENKSITLYISDFLKAITDPVLELLTL